MTYRDALLLGHTRSVWGRIAKLREEEPAAAEVAAIKAGIKEFSDGRFIELTQLRRELSHHRQLARPEILNKCKFRKL